MYRMADAKNVDMVNIFLNEDAVLNFSNAPPLQGRAALERLYVWEYGACPRIDHRWGLPFHQGDVQLANPVLFYAASKIVSIPPVD